jgi:glucose-1-phosphate thymidylyltransferase
MARLHISGPKRQNHVTKSEIPELRPGATKAVILARGLGTRMRASGQGNPLLDREQANAADRGLKSMIPMSDGRPFLDYLLAALTEAGIQDVCLVVGPEHREVRDRYSSSRGEHGARVHFAIQDEPRGTADALLAAETFVGSDAFLSLNSDNYYPVPLLEELRRQSAPALPIFARERLIRDAGIPRERIERYALLEIADDGVLRRIIEKPSPEVARALEDAPVSMNVWLFTPEIFIACRRVRPSPRGELELPLAVQLAIDELGMRFRTFHATEPVFDLSHREDIPHVAARLSAIARDS